MIIVGILFLITIVYMDSVKFHKDNVNTHDQNTVIVRVQSRLTISSINTLNHVMNGVARKILNALGRNLIMRGNVVSKKYIFN